MPEFKSVLGEWFPTDESARIETEAKGVETIGKRNAKVAGPSASTSHTWRENPLNFPVDQGVMPIVTKPKIAKDRLDGVRVAEPTPAQKVIIDKKKK